MGARCTPSRTTAGRRVSARTRDRPYAAFRTGCLRSRTRGAALQRRPARACSGRCGAPPPAGIRGRSRAAASRAGSPSRVLGARAEIEARADRDVVEERELAGCPRRMASTLAQALAWIRARRSRGRAVRARRHRRAGGRAPSRRRARADARRVRSARARRAGGEQRAEQRERAARHRDPVREHGRRRARRPRGRARSGEQRSPRASAPSVRRRLRRRAGSRGTSASASSTAIGGSAGRTYVTTTLRLSVKKSSGARLQAHRNARAGSSRSRASAPPAGPARGAPGSAGDQGSSASSAKTQIVPYGQHVAVAVAIAVVRHEKT